MNKAAALLYRFQLYFKIFLILSTFSMSLHCALLLLGIKPCVVEFTIILPLLPFLILFATTYVLKLCLLSRSILIYNYIVSVCIYLQKNFQFFGEYLLLARWIVMCCGFVITVFLVRKMWLGVKNIKCK